MGSWQERANRDDEIDYLLDRIQFELECARHNIDKCPDDHSAEERESIGELQHSDEHVENALGYIDRLKQLL